MQEWLPNEAEKYLTFGRLCGIMEQRYPFVAGLCQRDHTTTPGGGCSCLIPTLAAIVSVTSCVPSDPPYV